MSPEEFIHNYYLKFKEYMKSKYNWTPNEGEFTEVVTWIIKSGILSELKPTKEVDSGRTKRTKSQ
jgi:hypothetical protein